MKNIAPPLLLCNHTPAMSERRQAISTEERAGVLPATAIWEHLADVLVQVDAHTGQIELCSPSVQAITGFSVLEVVGRSLLDFVFPEDAALVRGKLVQVAALQTGESVAFRCLSSDGTYFWGEARGSVIYDKTGIKILIVIRNIAERKKFEQRLVQLARTDNLTGLFNRHALMERLAEKCVKDVKPFAVFLLDLDRFKHINDTYGHSYGDELLVEIARRLRLTVRQADLVARIGGDEFVIVAPSVDSEEKAIRLANKILEAVAQPVNINGHLFYPRTSIGISLFPLHCSHEAELLMCADKAMYVAKKQKSGYVLYGLEAPDTIANQMLAIERILHEALEQGRVTIHLQPICDSGRLVITSAEALMRVTDKAGKAISPADFIPIAEQTGLIVQLGDFVIKEVLAILRHQPTLVIAVNVSGQQLKDVNFVPRLKEYLLEFNVEGKQLEIELTESIFMENSAKLIATLTQLTNLGITLSIDDFGTGYSSLSYLRYLPITKIKIDRSFIVEMPENTRDTALVQALVQMSRPLGLKVVAEGVETEAQADVLRTAGCHYFQGYLYHKPMPIATFLETLVNNRPPLKRTE
ncbi:MAG: EAL domain-containing protein [Agitococcus sp.]|nr:EAL domain-containing protein [Agitococcus sp.]